MILKRLKIKNIRSYKEAEINFPEGSTLLMGDIGSGKTSVLLAVEFALFGLQPSQRGSSLLRSSEDEAEVRLEFEVDEQNVVIERNIQKSGKSISQGEAAITINNERVEGSVTEIKNRVLSLLNYPLEFAKKTNDLYKFTVYTPQEEMKQIILEPPETRLNTLRHVFGIDKYKRISENLDILGVKLRQEIRLKESQLGDISQLRQTLREKKNAIVSEKEKIALLNTEIEKTGQKRIESQSSIKELEIKISEKNNVEKEKARAEAMLSNKREAVQTYEKEMGALKEQIAEGRKFKFREEDAAVLKSRIEHQEQTLKQFNEEHIILASRMQSQEEKKKEIDSLKRKITGMNKCPTCLQEVNEEYKKNIFSNADGELRRIEGQAAADRLKKAELAAKIEQARKLIEAYKNSLSELIVLKVKLEGLVEKEKRLEAMDKQKMLASRDIVMIQEQIGNLKRLILDFDKYTPVFEQKNRELQAITAQENRLLISRAELNKDIQFLEQQTKTTEDEIKKLDEISGKIAYLKEIEYWLTNKFESLVLYTERNIMLKLREEFMNLFSSWFSMLVSEELSVGLDETFSPIIRQSDYELDYTFLSGGERTAVALAYRLALNQVINSLLSKIKTHDLVILDEPTDGFSESQLDKMRDVLHQLKVRQLILVSHEQKIEGFVDNIIRFKKTEGVTEVSA